MSNVNYTSTWLVNWFNSFPRFVAFSSFEETFSTFTPEDTEYLQGVAFWAAIPLVWLMLSLLFYFIYFLSFCCCCKNQSESRKSLKRLKWLLVIVTLLCIAGIGIGIYGNEESHRGVTTTETALKETNDTLISIENQLSDLEKLFNDKVTLDIENLVINLKLLPNATVLNQSLELVEAINTSMAESTDEIQAILHQIGDLSFQAIPGLHSTEFYRWLGTILIFCWELLVCLLVLCGVGKTSRCLFFWVSILSIITIILCFGSMSIEFFGSIALSDFCYAPENYIYQQFNNSIGLPDKEILDYYLYCYPSYANPFLEEIQNAQTSIALALKDIELLEELVGPYYSTIPNLKKYVLGLENDLKETSGNFMTLISYLECPMLHKSYYTGLSALCYESVFGLGFILVACSVVGIMLSMVICTASCAWRRVNTRKGFYEVDRDDPFLPRPQDSRRNMDDYYGRNASRQSLHSMFRSNTNITALPHSNSISQGFGIEAPPQPGVEQAPLIGGSPPPTYNMVAQNNHFHGSSGNVSNHSGINYVNRPAIFFEE